MKQLHILLDISKQLPWRRGIPRHIVPEHRAPLILIPGQVRPKTKDYEIGLCCKACNMKEEE